MSFCFYGTCHVFIPCDQWADGHGIVGGDAGGHGCCGPVARRAGLLGWLTACRLGHLMAVRRLYLAADGDDGTCFVVCFMLVVSCAPGWRQLSVIALFWVKLLFYISFPFHSLLDVQLMSKIVPLSLFSSAKHRQHLFIVADFVHSLTLPFIWSCIGVCFFTCSFFLPYILFFWFSAVYQLSLNFLVYYKHSISCHIVVIVTYIFYDVMLCEYFDSNSVKYSCSQHWESSHIVCIYLLCHMVSILCKQISVFFCPSMHTRFSD